MRGDIAGASTRLQPAYFQVSWEKSSVADVLRLFGNSDFGVRGTFAGEASAQSGGALVPEAKNAEPGDWLFSVTMRAGGIHRWDLTERSDNPRVGIRADGSLNPGSR